VPRTRHHIPHTIHQQPAALLTLHTTTPQHSLLTTRGSLPPVTTPLAPPHTHSPLTTNHHSPLTRPHHTPHTTTALQTTHQTHQTHHTPQPHTTHHSPLIDLPIQVSSIDSSESFPSEFAISVNLPAIFVLVIFCFREEYEARRRHATAWVRARERAIGGLSIYVHYGPCPPKGRNYIV
jgi:hypothetical protein